MRKGATSKKRHRPTQDAELSFGSEYHFLHSTPINENAAAFIPNTPDFGTPIVISAPTGFPYFTSKLQAHGFFVAVPRNHLQVDQLVFRRALTQFFEKAELPERSKFMKELEGYLNASDNFYHSMTPTLHPDELLQESLLQNFLNIPYFHKVAMDVLLPQIMELSFNVVTQEDEDLLETMLSQLRWLEHSNLEASISFLIEILENSTNAAKSMILKFLPNIVPDDQHLQLVQPLRNLLDIADSPIIPAIMECMSGLDICSTELEGNYAYAITQLLQAPLRDYPAYLTFLFKVDDYRIAANVVQALRTNFEVLPMGESPEENAYFLVEIVKRIRLCASAKSIFLKIWFDHILRDVAYNEENLKPLDLTMVLIFIGTVKSANCVLKDMFLNVNKIAELLDHMISYTLPIVSEVSHAFIKFCNSIVWNTERVDAYLGAQKSLVYLFLALNTPEIIEIGTSVIHNLTNGDTGAREIALQIFAEIASQNPMKLLPFAVPLMNILEACTTFPATQLRDLMQLLTSLAYVDGSSESERFRTEYMFFLRKYMAHTSIQNRYIGVIGVLVIVNKLSTRTPATDESRILELLMVAWSIVKREEGSCRLFFDELVKIANIIPKNILEQFQPIMSKCFEESWIHSSEEGSDMEPGQHRQSQLTVSSQFGTVRNITPMNDEEEEDDLKIFVFEERPLGMSPQGVPAHARLLFQLSMEIKDMQQILIRPLCFPDIDLYYKNMASIESCTFAQRQSLGLHLVTAINFFRECISAFVEEKDAMIQIHVWFRLSNIVALQQLLVRNIKKFPGLPEANVTEKQYLLSCDGIKKTKGRPPNSEKNCRGQKRKRESPDDEDQERVLLSEVKRTTDCSIQPLEITPFLRTLKPAVFQLLEATLCLNDPVSFDSIWQRLSCRRQSSKQLLSIVKELNPEDMCLLLLEINQQNGNPDINFSIIEVDNLIRWITIHLDKVVAEYETSSQLKGVRKLEECLRLILTTYATYFATVLKVTDPVERSNYDLEILKGLTATSDLDETEMRRPLLIETAISFFKKVSVAVTKSARALDHLKAVNGFQALFRENDMVSAAVVTIAEHYLNCDWKISSSEIQYILKAWVLQSTEPMATIGAISAAILETGDQRLASCTPVNFHKFYSVLFQLLAQYIAKNGKAASNNFEFWNEAVLIFKNLVFVSETHRKGNVLAPLLKHSRSFIDSYGANGTCLLPGIYKERLTDFRPFVRQLQLATRKLQVICEHSKVLKDTRLMRNVPQMKRSLERLVFRVRELFTVNNISDAFWLGSLRHRTMDGDEIGSQPFNNNSWGSEEPMEEPDEDAENEDPMDRLYSNSTEYESDE